jgi:segregation and condensation protein B
MYLAGAWDEEKRVSTPNPADVIEALLFAAGAPVPLRKLAQAAQVPEEQALEEIALLREEKSRVGALHIVEVADGWQMVTKPAFASFVRALKDVPKQRLSRAAFEVLAITAYRQPVTRGEIESLRGVDCSGPLQFLLEKKLLLFAGRRDTPGRPWQYTTAPAFLEHFGLRSLDDLPPLSEWQSLGAPEGAEPNATDNSLFGAGVLGPAPTRPDETDVVDSDHAQVLGVEAPGD